jgi:hypothetical protein
MKYPGFQCMCIRIARKLCPARLYLIFFHSAVSVTIGQDLYLDK